jgi:uncharacterized protein YuzE/predicted DNA-binding transcriptional regulator AlpA
MLSTVQIDTENDLAYILLRPELQDRRGVVSRSVRVAEDFVVDLDHDGQIVGIEILHASSRLNLKRAGEAPCDVVAGVAEAAEMVGIKKPNFVRDYANKTDFPAPIVALASGRLWLRSDIEEYLRRRRKPGCIGIPTKPTAEMSMPTSAKKREVLESVTNRSDPTQSGRQRRR